MFLGLNRDMKISKLLQPKIFIKNIDGRLYTGKPIPSPVGLHQIKKLGVTQVIDLREDAFWKKLWERINCNLMGIKYKNIKVKTHTLNIPNIDFFNNINSLITSNKGNTYLHCKYGKHRTGMCVAAYEKDVLKKNPLNVYISLTNRFSEISGLSKTNKEIQKKLKVIYYKFVNLYHLNDGNKSTRIYINKPV